MIIIELDDCKVQACIDAGQLTHRWEFDRFTMREMLRAQETLGLDPDQLQDALNEAESKLTPNSIRATLMLLNILHRRSGVLVTFEETDADLFGLRFLPDPDAAQEDAEAGGKDGTQTSPLPGDDGPGSSTSGRSKKAGSAARSSPTPLTSGVSSG